jgi:ubiquitin
MGMNFTEVKSILETITHVVKASATLDLHEKIVNLREFIIEIKDENIALKEENQSLKHQLSVGQNFALKNGLYWKEEDAVPFCPTCLDASKKPIHLQPWADDWKCFVCRNYYAPRGRAGDVHVYNPWIDEPKNPAR